MIDDIYRHYQQLTGDPLAASNLCLAHAMLDKQPTKEWYTCGEVAEILGKSEFTIRERWCNSDRIECQKEGANWRIPHHEVERLRNGGQLSPKR